MTNLIKVYSPSGEVFENSPANARDLVTHAGWSYHPPTNSDNETTVMVESSEEGSEDEEDSETESEATDGTEEQNEFHQGQEVTPLRGRRKKVQ